MREFKAAFAAAEMIGIMAEMHGQMHRAMERVGKLVQKAAKEEIGEYQDGAGPFITWPELADYTKDDRVKRGFTENDPGLRTGDMRDSIDFKVVNGMDHHTAHIGSDEDKMVYFELGTVTQPPRSVLGLAAVRNEDKIRAILGEAVVLAMAGEAGLFLVGAGVFGGKMDITK